MLISPVQNAVIQEGLRFAYGLSARLQRSNPVDVMMFHEYEISPGVRYSLYLGLVRLSAHRLINISRRHPGA